MLRSECIILLEKGCVMITSPDYYQHDLVYNWNDVQHEQTTGRSIEFDDESLRDGLQSPTVVIPAIEDKFPIDLTF